jgi:lysophospholipase L1-like esterase
MQHSEPWYQKYLLLPPPPNSRLKTSATEERKSPDHRSNRPSVTQTPVRERTLPSMIAPSIARPVALSKQKNITGFTCKLPVFPVLIMAAALSYAARAQSRVFVPAAPEGVNSAVYAAPRDDWFLTVQGKFDRYSAKPSDILFDGDSITNRWETTGREVWEAQFAGRSADFGIEGDRTENLLWRLSKGQVSGVSPRLVVLMIGTNNVSRNNADEIAAGVEEIVKQYEDLCPSAHILLMAIFPRGRSTSDPNRLKVSSVNEDLRIWSENAKDSRLSFLDIGKQLITKDGDISPDMMPDMLHPTLIGYRIWADAIAPYVEHYAPKTAH